MRMFRSRLLGEELFGNSNQPDDNQMGMLFEHVGKVRVRRRVPAGRGGDRRGPRGWLRNWLQSWLGSFLL